METTDLSSIIGQEITHISIGKFSVSLELTSGPVLRIEPIIHNKDGDEGNPYAMLLVRVAE